MKMAEYLATKVKAGEVDAKAVPAQVREGVARYYGEKQQAADFAWAEWECSHSKITR